MTSKEIEKKAKGVDFFDFYTLCGDELRKYKTHLCKEQREECERNFRGHAMKLGLRFTKEQLSALSNAIINAPTP